MKLHTGISLLLLAAITHAAPSSPAYVQVYQTEQVEEEEPRPIAVDFWPQDDVFGFEEERFEDDDSTYPDVLFDPSPFQGSVDLDFTFNQDNIPVLANDTLTNIIFKDLEQRIAEDVRRMQEDFLLFKRLFGRRHTAGRRPSWLTPWGTPEDAPAPVPDESVHDDAPTTYDYNPLIPNHGNGDDLFSGLPLLGMDRPLFPGLPEIPGFGIANPDDLPDNYSNKTHEVHSINGTQVVVNSTINKESGDDFNSFFHHQVIHFKPEEEAGVPDGSAGPVTEVPEVSQEEDDTNTILPSVENESDSGSLSPEPIPEINAEIVSSDTHPELDGSRLEIPTTGEEEFEINDMLTQQERGRVAARSLREFNPIVFPADDPRASVRDFPGPMSASYVSNSLTEGEHEEGGRDFAAKYEAEEVEIDDSERRAPDLSNDTRVNRIHANKQGMTQVDPDAEIFNYGLVLKEAQPRDGDI